MSEKRKIFSMISMLSIVLILVAVSGCKKDDDPEPDPPRTTTNNLMIKDVLGINGTVTFTETSTTVATIGITLIGAPAGIHPAELCMNTAVEGGPVVITLNPVDETGKSTTTVTSKSYSQLIIFDGFIKVMMSSSEPDVILAQGDIGGNVITSVNKTYPLGPVGSFGVTGSALFEKRLNGNTLLTITVTGAIAGEEYPATINLGSIETVGGGPVVISLSNVFGTTGKSYTTIRKLNSNVPITYDNLMVYDGYLNIYQNSVNITNIICQGNIGSN